MVSIFFGSQSGTAECFAEEIREGCEENGIPANVCDMQGFTPEDFPSHRLVVLVVSTYGEGEPTDNAVAFDKWASHPQNDGALAGVRFTVMGLGDMNYSKFNNMGLQCDMNMERLGGTRIYQRGVGDDSQDIHADFCAWKDAGLWAALKRGCAEVAAEGPIEGAGAAKVDVASFVLKPEVWLFVGGEEDGASQPVADGFAKQLKAAGLEISGTQTMAERKAFEAVRKLPRKAVAVIIVEGGAPGALSTNGKKLVRNLQLELEIKCLEGKGVRAVQILVDADPKAGEAMTNAWERVGIDFVGGASISAAAGDREAALADVCNSVACAANEVASAAPVSAGPAAAVAAPAPRWFCAIGDGAREPAQVVADNWPGAAEGAQSVDDASLQSLVAAVQQKERAVIAVEVSCSLMEGGLSRESRQLAQQISAAPPALQAQLRQLRFGLLVVVASDFGNAGERASAEAAQAEFAKSAAIVSAALMKFGAKCVASVTLDMQDADSARLSAVCDEFAAGFAAGAAPVAAAAPAPKAGASAGGPAGAPVLRVEASAADLPAEVPYEPSDVLARFYFDAVQAKVAKCDELRQKVDPDAGLSTAEVVIEATGGLKGYSLGGTLTLLPENRAADVVAMLPLLGLTQKDLGKHITFLPSAGAGSVKKPFPTPCTIGVALTRYCDLNRAPTKKMLTALQLKLKDMGAGDRVGKLIADTEALKKVQSSPLCVRQHEFWPMVGVSRLELGDFLVHCPRQKPREFTIASSPKAAPDQITLCVSNLRQEQPDLSAALDVLSACGALVPGFSPPARQDFFNGVCSQWLTSKAKTGDPIFAKQRPSALHLPGKDVPIIMVGAGAGVAPFRGFWEEIRRSDLKAPAALFFGCRNSEQDWLFKQEMNGAVKAAASGCAALQRVQANLVKKPLTCLYTAFSRPGQDKKGQYVQDQIRAQSRSVKHWVEKMDGMVYICGSSAMGNGTLEALSEALEGGRETVDALRQEGRIVCEFWG